MADNLGVGRRHERDVQGLIIGGSVLLVTAALARRGVVPGEERLFRSANELPDGAYRPVWAVMQYGTFGTVPAIAVVQLLRRRPRFALAVAAGGGGAWALAKVVKRLVGRTRPAGVMAGVRLRGKEEGDLGFPSGHAAVSAALTVVAWPRSGAGWRAVSSVLTVLVPFARLYVGAHLPLDVIGGSALGLTVGSAVNLALGVPDPTREP
jgi:undecaprenyl-diphosphatase